MAAKPTSSKRKPVVKSSLTLATFGSTQESYVLELHDDGKVWFIETNWGGKKLAPILADSAWIESWAPMMRFKMEAAVSLLRRCFEVY